MHPPAVIVFHLFKKIPPKSLQPTYIPGTGHDFCLMCDLLSTVRIRFLSSLHVFDSFDLASSIDYFVKRKRKKDWERRGLVSPFPSLVGINSINSIVER